MCRLPLTTCYASTPFITRHRLNGRKQTTYSPVITAEEAAKTLGRDTDEKLYLCAGFVQIVGSGPEKNDGKTWSSKKLAIIFI